MDNGSTAGVTKAVRRKLPAVQYTDAGNAEVFEYLHGHRFRYNHTSCKWLVWNGQHWSEDKDGEANRAALTTIRARFSEATRIRDRDRRRDRVRWCLDCESVWHLKAMLTIAGNIRSLATTAAQFDQAPFLLTVANGTLDLQTGQLRPSRPEDLLTSATDVPFEPDAKAPRWMRFLDEVFLGDADLITFIQRAVGYSLTGETQEQCFFILHGAGANGKTTFVETICELLGIHAETAAFSSFLDRRDSGSPRNDLARLHAARFVKAAEGEHEARFAESVIKQLTGGDTVVARFLFKEHFQFKPQFKIWLTTNHKPKIRGTDEAIWRRVRLIPFREQFEGTKKDPDVRRKLQEELPGILAWAVKGCLSWQKHGLGMTPQVERATLEYRQESDQIGRFLKERCTIGPKSSTKGREFFEAYVEWCGVVGEKAEANLQFARRMAERGISKKRLGSGMVYQGVGLAPVAPAITSPRSIQEKNQ